MTLRDRIWIDLSKIRLIESGSDKLDGFAYEIRSIQSKPNQLKGLTG